MNGTHEPRESFVRALEARVGTEAARRAASPRLPRWVPQSRGRLVFATAMLILVSMAAGGAAVSVTYQAQAAEGRDFLVRAYQQRLDLAKARLDLALKLSKSLEERAQVGAATNMEMQDAKLKSRQAQYEVLSLMIQLDEVRTTGLEPATQVSAPLASGRDFLSDRWRVEMSAQRAALETEQVRLQTAQTRVSVGVADSFEIEPIRAHVKELEAAISGYERKLDIRQQFLKRTLDAGLADLMFMAVDVDQRVAVLTSKIDVGRKELSLIQARVNVGTAQSLDLAEAQIRLHQTELEFSKAQYDQLLIRQQIAQRGK